MDPNLPVPSKIGQKSEMCLNSSLFHCPKCPKLDLFEYSKQKHTFSHSVRTSTLSCFDLGIIYSFRTYSKRTFTNKNIWRSIVQVKILAACKILGKWTFIFVISSTLCCRSILQFFYSRDIPTVVLFQIL